MQNGKIKFMLFSIGAVGYGLIEIIWRGYTHWSMLGAGGICFMFFGTLSEKFKKAGLFVKSLIGSSFVTGKECVGLQQNANEHRRSDLYALLLPLGAFKSYLHTFCGKSQ